MEPDFFAATHQGQKREVNQDRILVSLLGDGPATVMAVADGMGGEAAGDRAAEMVVQTIGHVSSRPMPGQDDKHFFTRLESMVYAARESLVAAVSDEPALASMGTTLTMACCDWPTLYVVHVGDSRCYLLRDGALERTTEDHTVAQRFVDEGVLSEEEAEKSPMAHQLWNVITAGREVKPERKQIDLREGDAVVLCSDGLTKHVSDSDIARIVKDSDSAESACHALIQAANEGGGSDNIAVVVGRF